MPPWYTNQSVHEGRARETVVARIVDGVPAQAGLGNAAVAPVESEIAEDDSPPGGHPFEQAAAGATCSNEADSQVRIPCQSHGQGTPGRAAATMWSNACVSGPPPLPPFRPSPPLAGLPNGKRSASGCRKCPGRRDAITVANRHGAHLRTAVKLALRHESRRASVIPSSREYLAQLGGLSESQIPLVV